MLRDFKDSDGNLWRVWDTRPTTSAVRASYRDGWLTFELDAPVGRAVRKRLAPIPAGWERMPDGELRRLCAEAKEESPRKRLSD